MKRTQSQTKLVDLGNKKIYEYGLPTKLLSVAYMIVAGRHPEKGFVKEKDCTFVIFVTKGKGKYIMLDKTVELKKDDVLLVEKNTKFAVEGNFEYVTFDIPAYYEEQSQVVD